MDPEAWVEVTNWWGPISPWRQDMLGAPDGKGCDEKPPLEDSDGASSCLNAAALYRFGAHVRF